MKIYKIVNRINNKHYIGQTKNINTRFKKHVACAKRKINRHLYDAMNCYGTENFSIHLIEEVEDNKADEREIFWVKELNTFSPAGYNMTLGGGGGYTLAGWADEDRKALYKRQGEKRRGKRSPEFADSFANGAKNREAKMSKEQKQERSRKSVETARARGFKSKPPIPRFGKDNWNFVEVDIERCKCLIKLQWKLKDIAVLFNTSGAVISSKLKSVTGKGFINWRREYGIKGSFGSVQRIDSSESSQS